MCNLASVEKYVEEEDASMHRHPNDIFDLDYFNLKQCISPDRIEGLISSFPDLALAENTVFSISHKTADLEIFLEACVKFLTGIKDDEETKNHTLEMEFIFTKFLDAVLEVLRRDKKYLPKAMQLIWELLKGTKSLRGYNYSLYVLNTLLKEGYNGWDSFSNDHKNFIVNAILVADSGDADNTVEPLEIDDEDKLDSKDEDEVLSHLASLELLSNFDCPITAEKINLITKWLTLHVGYMIENEVLDIALHFVDKFFAVDGVKVGDLLMDIGYSYTLKYNLEYLNLIKKYVKNGSPITDVSLMLTNCIDMTRDYLENGGEDLLTSFNDILLLLKDEFYKKDDSKTLTSLFNLITEALKYKVSSSDQMSVLFNFFFEAERKINPDTSLYVDQMNIIVDRIEVLSENSQKELLHQLYECFSKSGQESLELVNTKWIQTSLKLTSSIESINAHNLLISFLKDPLLSTQTLCLPQIPTRTTSSSSTSQSTSTEAFIQSTSSETVSTSQQSSTEKSRSTSSSVQSEGITTKSRPTLRTTSTKTTHVNKSTTSIVKPSPAAFHYESSSSTSAVLAKANTFNFRVLYILIPIFTLILITITVVLVKRKLCCFSKRKSAIKMKNDEILREAYSAHRAWGKAHLGRK